MCQQLREPSRYGPPSMNLKCLSSTHISRERWWSSRDRMSEYFILQETHLYKDLIFNHWNYGIKGYVMTEKLVTIYCKKKAGYKARCNIILFLSSIYFSTCVYTRVGVYVYLERYTSARCIIVNFKSYSMSFFWIWKLYKTTQITNINRWLH